MKRFIAANYIGAVIITTFLYSCTKEGDFSIGNKIIQSDASMVYTDTLTVSLSSFRMDSIQTSGKGLALVGQFSDKIIGTVGSQSYIVMGHNSLVLDKDIKLDSLVLLLKPSGYYYGDTSATYKIQVHEVTEKMVLDKVTNLMYNNTEFKFDEAPLGEKTVKARPKLKKEIRIPINTEFSQKLFEKLRSSAKPFNEQSPFVNYLKGIVLKSDQANSILGFSAKDSDSSIRFALHYHALGSDTAKILYIDPASAYTSFQYNQVVAKEGSTISSINEDPVSSKQLDNYALIQGGSGIFARVDFPTLRNLLLEPRKFEIIRADLVIQPSHNMDFNYLPEKLYIYTTNKHNDKLDYIRDAAGNQVLSTLVKDEIYKENTYYSWNITTYVKQILTSNDWESNGIHIVPIDYESKFDHVIIADQLRSKYKTCLKLYLLYYE